MKPELRAYIETLVELRLDTIEAIIAALDAVDGDADLEEQHDREAPDQEPWLSGLERGIYPAKRIRRAG